MADHDTSDISDIDDNSDAFDYNDDHDSDFTDVDDSVDDEESVVVSEEPNAHHVKKTRLYADPDSYSGLMNELLKYEQNFKLVPLDARMLEDQSITPVENKQKFDLDFFGVFILILPCNINIAFLNLFIFPDFVFNLLDDMAVRYFKELVGQQLTLSNIKRDINVACKKMCSSMDGYIVLVQYPLKVAVSHSGRELDLKKTIAEVFDNRKLAFESLCINEVFYYTLRLFFM